MSDTALATTAQAIETKPPKSKRQRKAKSPAPSPKKKPAAKAKSARENTPSVSARTRSRTAKKKTTAHKYPAKRAKPGKSKEPFVGLMVHTDAATLKKIDAKVRALQKTKPDERHSRGSWIRSLVARALR